MSRQTSRNFGELVGQAENSLTGLVKYEAPLGVRATTALIMSGVLEAACRSNAEYREAISAALAATAEQSVWFEKAGPFIALVRDNLKPTLGSRSNEAWGSVGLCNCTLAVPRTLARRLSLLQMIELFFITHPELEIPNVVSAALAKALFDGLLSALGAANAARAEQRKKKTVRDLAVTVLRQRLQGLRAELKLLLSPSDSRWLDFGFKVPTDVSVPEAPAEVKLALDAGHVKASWGHTVHTDRYRVYQRVVGKDVEPVLLDTTTDTSYDLGTFAAGTELEVQVAAVNAAGEGKASEMARFEMPNGNQNIQQPTSNIEHPIGISCGQDVPVP